MSKRANYFMIALAAGSLTLTGWSPTSAQDPNTSGSPQAGSQGQTTSGSHQKGGHKSTKAGHEGMESSHSGAMSQGASTLSGMDRKFIMDAAMGGMAEVEHGRLAAERGSSEEVKSFGQRMVDDHSKANDELKQLAQQKGIMLPADIGPKHKAMHDRLSKLSGAAFDRAYMTEMVKDHTKDVAEFEKASMNSKDADLKSWAAGKLPTLREHLQMARDTAGKMTGGKKGMAKPASSTERR